MLRRSLFGLVSIAAFAIPSTAFALRATVDDWTDPARHPNDAVRPIPSFAEGTPEHYMLAVDAALDRMYGPKILAYQMGTRWPGVSGDPITLTWSFVPDGLFITSGIGETASPSVLFSSMNVDFSNGQALWISKIQSCFDRWEALSGIDFVRVTAPGVEWDDGAPWGSNGNGTTRGDIRICSHAIDGTSGILNYAMPPTNGDIVVDPAENWNLGAPSNKLFRNSIAKNTGLTVGLQYVCPWTGTKLMESQASSLKDGPQQDDIRAIHRHYGDIHEPDDSAFAAFDIGVLANGTLLFGPAPAPSIASASLFSIDADGEEDWWKFEIDGPISLNVTLTPVGTSYPSGPSASFCTTPPTINALTMANLDFEVRSGSTGQTVLSTASTHNAGVAESIVNLVLPTADTYFVRVFESDSPTESQLYDLRLEATSLCLGSTSPGGPGCAGSGGCVPAIAMTGCPQSNQNFGYSVSNGVGGQLAILLMGLSSGSVTASNGCVLQLGSLLPSTVPLVLSGSGSCSGASAVATMMPTLSSATLHFQAACADPGHAGGFTLSNSVAVTFAP